MRMPECFSELFVLTLGCVVGIVLAGGVGLLAALTYDYAHNLQTTWHALLHLTEHQIFGAAARIRRTVSAAESAYIISQPANYTLDWAESEGVEIGNVLRSAGLRGPANYSREIKMSTNEAHELIRALSHATRYLEWGAGGSTELVAWLMLSRQVVGDNFHALSIESSELWTSALRAKGTLVSKAVASRRMHLHHPENFFNTTGLGFPDPTEWKDSLRTNVSTGGTRAAALASRSVSVPRSPGTGTGTGGRGAPVSGPFDVVLVDGRWRVACALYAHKHLRANGTLLIHDFGPPMFASRRHEYERVLGHGTFRLERLVRSLAVLRPIPLTPLSERNLQKALASALVSPNRRR